MVFCNSTLIIIWIFTWLHGDFLSLRNEQFFWDTMFDINIFLLDETPRWHPTLMVWHMIVVGASGDFHTGLLCLGWCRGERKKIVSSSTSRTMFSLMILVSVVVIGFWCVSGFWIPSGFWVSFEYLPYFNFFFSTAWVSGLDLRDRFQNRKYFLNYGDPCNEYVINVSAPRVDDLSQLILSFQDTS